jgi:MFS family permease
MRLSPEYDRTLVLWLSLGQLITWGSVFYGFALFVGPAEQSLSLDRAQTSLAFSLGLLAEGILAYPVGRWIDRGYERAAMTAGSLAMAAGLGALALVQSAAGFFAVWIALGAAFSATLYNPAFAVVTRRFPNDYRRAIITLTFLGGLASTVFIPLTALLISQWGWRAAAAALATIHLCVCVPIHWIVLRHAPGPSVAQDAASSTPPPGLGLLLRSPAFLLIGVFVVLMMGVTAALPVHMVSLLRESGLHEAWVIAIPACIGVIQVVGRLLLFFFERRFDVHLANRVIPILIPLGLAALLASIGAGALAPLLGLLFVLLYGLGNGMLTIVKGTAMAQYVDRSRVASLNGALGVPTAAARALAPLALGLWWSREAGYRWGLWALLLASIVAVLALWLAQRSALKQDMA